MIRPEPADSNEPGLASSRSYDPDYILSKNPDLLVILSLSRDQMLPEGGWNHRLYTAFVELGFEGIRVIGGPYLLWLVARPESAIAVSLRSWEPRTFWSRAEPRTNARPATWRR